MLSSRKSLLLGFVGLCTLGALLGLWANAQVAPAVPGLQLGLPLQCRLNETCWVYNYVDVDPSPEVLDAACGHRSYDGHTGTDFGLRDLAQMREGVPVVASASGVVKNIRDGMRDISVDVGGKAAIQGRECGNGVVIEHADGWTTQYCHLRQGSVRVKPGESVKIGQTLGLVGLSGNTEFPHVHLTVRHNDEVVDPFLPQPVKGHCLRGVPSRSLWKAPITYQPLSLVNWGVADTQPDVDQVRNGGYRETKIARTAPMLIFWVDALGIEPGDVLHMTITNPQGQTVVDQATPLKSRKARWFQYVGKRSATLWPTGVYRGTVSLNRAETGVSQSRTLVFTVAD